MVVKLETRIKNVKTVRIEMDSVESKWSAFSLYAKSINVTPRKLLGQALDQFITKNLDAITSNLAKHYELEEDA